MHSPAFNVLDMWREIQTLKVEIRDRRAGADVIFKKVHAFWAIRDLDRRDNPEGLFSE